MFLICSYVSYMLYDDRGAVGVGKEGWHAQGNGSCGKRQGRGWGCFTKRPPPHVKLNVVTFRKRAREYKSNAHEMICCADLWNGNQNLGPVCSYVRVYMRQYVLMFLCFSDVPMSFLCHSDVPMFLCSYVILMFLCASMFLCSWPHSDTHVVAYVCVAQW